MIARILLTVASLSMPLRVDGGTRAPRPPQLRPTPQHWAAIRPTLRALNISADDVLCGRPAVRARGAGDLRCLNLPTYWINMDASDEKRLWMRRQLRARLAAGVCATRVSAVLLSEVSSVVSGGGGALHELASRPRLRPGEAPRPGLIVDDAIALSHLKAMHVALATAPPGAPGYLILEDDIDFSPLVHFQPVLALAQRGGASTPPRVHAPRASSLHALVAHAGERWSTIQLDLAPMRGGAWQRRGWAELQQLWRKHGSPPLLEKRLLEVRSAALGGVACGHDPPIFSAAAYLVSPRAAHQLARQLWPVSAAPELRAGVRVRVKRFCFPPLLKWPLCERTVTGWSKHALRLYQQPAFVSDFCFTNNGLYGPPLTFQQFAAHYNSSRAAPQQQASARQHTARAARSAWRDLIATPPWFSECSASDGRDSGAHTSGKPWRNWHCYRKRGAFSWYEQLCDPTPPTITPTTPNYNNEDMTTRTTRGRRGSGGAWRGPACTATQARLLARRTALQIDGLVMKAPADGGGLAPIPAELRRAWVEERRAKLRASSAWQLDGGYGLPDCLAANATMDALLQPMCRR